MLYMACHSNLIPTAFPSFLPCNCNPYLSSRLPFCPRQLDEWSMTDQLTDELVRSAAKKSWHLDRGYLKWVSLYLWFLAIYMWYPSSTTEACTLHYTADGNYLFTVGIHTHRTAMEHHINSQLCWEIHQLIKVPYPTDHQQSAPEEANPTHHIRTGPYGHLY